jgi:hypothetical protein
MTDGVFAGSWTRRHVNACPTENTVHRPAAVSTVGIRCSNSLKLNNGVSFHAISNSLIILSFGAKQPEVSTATLNKQYVITCERS